MYVRREQQILTVAGNRGDSLAADLVFLDISRRVAAPEQRHARTKGSGYFYLLFPFTFLTQSKAHPFTHVGLQRFQGPDR